MDINDIRFGKCRDWIRTKRQEEDYSWEQLHFAGQQSEEGLEDFLTSQIKYNNWPIELDAETWYKIVDVYKSVHESSSPIKYTYPGLVTVSDIPKNPYIGVPQDPSSCWQLYKKQLIKKGFSQEIDIIEKSCYETLSRLRDDTQSTGPIKGLVVGNVQSGKTANMAGLMAMAADYGWNFFIILSGTIENLRKQTLNRFCNDLQGLSNGNINWQGLDQLSPTSSDANKLRFLHLDENNNMRYFTVCLKVKKRLEDLIDWLQEDPKKLSKMKILIIDDEADQASINTGKIKANEEETQRKEINRLIINLVHFRNKKSKSPKEESLPVKAVNYISYTATPYANCLNESGPNTLYPQHFIHCLVPSQKYIGPSQLYKVDDVDKPVLNITRNINKDDVKIIKAILKGTVKSIPQSLEDALLWFIISAACMRCYNSKKPVSMLIHLSQKQADHEKIADLITTWFKKNKNSIVELCKPLYDKETKLFSKQAFREGYSEYALKDEDIPDYPPFEALIPHINDLIKQISHVKMADKTTPTYNKSIHLCIDNSKNNGLTEEGDHIRLLYPDSNKIDFATAFIVIGGNTLARGLTLQGLTSTYFHRDVLQSDTLMQMARWFGYRIGYELLPRIWMSDTTEEKFNFLTELDEDLRHQLSLLQNSGMKPLDFEVSLKNSPKAKFLLTAKNKMQSAITSEVDCSGLDTQLTTYGTESYVIKNNLYITQEFLKKLGNGQKSEITSAYYWEDVDYEIINKYFLKKLEVYPTSRTFQNLDLINDWVKNETKKGNMTSWNIICAGIAPDEYDDSKNWILPSGFKIGKIERTPKGIYSDHISIGVLSSKKDYLSDIKRNMLNDDIWQALQTDKNFSRNYKFYRKEAGFENKPFLVLYMIDKNSNQSSNVKQSLSLVDDLIGVAMVTPGIREQKHVVKTRVKIHNIGDSEQYDEY